MTIRQLLLIIVGALILISFVTALILFIRSRSVAKVNTVPSPTPVVSEMQLPVTTPTETTPVNGLGKTHSVNGTVFSYPTNWGLLTCTNSMNFELDPYSNQNSKVACDVAKKPITVIVNGPACQGGVIANIEGTQVMRIQKSVENGKVYQWCFNHNGRQYNISHRVSSNGQQGVSVDDFSAQIEEMLKAFHASNNPTK